MRVIGCARARARESILISVDIYRAAVTAREDAENFRVIRADRDRRRNVRARMRTRMRTWRCLVSEQRQRRK
jgi:hypothetical protein